jgi:CheY-like chemotaxis protein
MPRANLQTILDNLTAGVIVLDPAGASSRPTRAPRASCGPLAAYVGRRWPHCPAGGLRPRVQAQFDQFEAARIEHGPDHWQHAFELHGATDGANAEAVSLVAARPAGRAAPAGVRRHLRDRLAQRTQAWGEVARRLAHEIKNPLTPIQLSAERLEHSWPTSCPNRPALLIKSVHTIVDQVDAMKRLVNEFRDYAPARRRSSSPGPERPGGRGAAPVRRPDGPAWRRGAGALERDGACPPSWATRSSCARSSTTWCKTRRTPPVPDAAQAAAGGGVVIAPSGRPARSACACRSSTMARLSRRHSQARLRALRHHQGQGHRPGPGGGQEDRRRTWRARGCVQSHRRWARCRGASVIDIRARPSPPGQATRPADLTQRKHAFHGQHSGGRRRTGHSGLLSEILNDEGHTVELAENAAQARAAQNACPDLVLLDIWMPDTDGVTLLKEWGGAGLLTMPVIMMSGHATIETAVEATHRRARLPRKAHHAAKAAQGR